jgi:PKD repeat protein
MQNSSGAISYSLNPNIQFGNPIKYVLLTDYGFWEKRDTIIKFFGSYNLVSSEDASVTSNWSGNWSTTTSTYVSPTKCFFDGSLNNYSNNSNKIYTYNPSIDLSNASSAKISFYAKWALESDYDFVQFQVSSDGGNTWVGQCGNYTVLGVSGGVQPLNKPLYEGTKTDWVLEEIDLSDYLGQTIKVRFQLRSDGGTTADGFYFDDFNIYINPTEIASTPTAQFSVSDSTICLGNSISFGDNSTNFPTQWNWYFGDGGTSNDQNPIYTFNNSGTYTVSLVASNSVGSDTAIQVISVDNCMGIDFQLNKRFLVYPNPNDGAFGIVGLDGNSIFEITDINGKVLFVGNSSIENEINVPNFNSGIYCLSGISNGVKVRLKIAVLK